MIMQMHNSTKTAETVLKKRKIYIASVLIGTFFFLVLFNVGSWLFVKQIERYLDDELGKRLTSAAGLTAMLIEDLLNSVGDVQEEYYNPFSDDYVRAFTNLTLAESEKYTDLQGSFIVDNSYTILVTTSQEIFSLGDRLSYIQEDSLLFAQAWNGTIIVSPLHVLENNRFKSAYAPIRSNAQITVAVLVLEANADFFELLRNFNSGRTLGIISSAGLLLLLSLFLYWAVTLFLRTESSLRQAERLAYMGQMAATVAHEIRNPLGVISSTADVLKQRYNNPDKPDELFDYIPLEIRRLNRLVNDFLVLSREPKLQLAKNNIQDCIQKAVTVIKPEFKAADVTLNTTTDSPPPAFSFDQDALYQVLLNILINALQATPAGGRVNILVIGLKNNIKIEITDTGSGIEGDIEKVFEPFYSTKATGSGLGLAVTRKIIESHGGSITIKSEKNKGTCVTIILPA